MSEAITQRAYEVAKERYAAWGVDTDAAVEQLCRIPISLHCWQGDDVGGFESAGDMSDGGILATGDYPGKARNADELRADVSKVFGLVPGKHRLNLHAIYAETGGKHVDRNEQDVSHYRNWIDWAKELGIGLDHNPSFFAHPKAASGFTLSSADEGVRRFWVEHGIVSRQIGEKMGLALGTPCVTNVWIPDGYKDTPVDRQGPRVRLQQSLNEIFAEALDPKGNLDALESKLFGLGSESYVVGSHEFYMGYAVKHGKLLCLDSGHFHPTEQIADKLSSVMLFVDEVLLHVSRGVRWDSDHVTILSDETRAIAQEVVRGGLTDRVHIGLDFFDGSINRVAAWTNGMRCMQKALLLALLEPIAKLRKVENTGDFTGRLVLLEEVKSLPFGAVWDYVCEKRGVPVGEKWLDEVRTYEADVLAKRG